MSNRPPRRRASAAASLLAAATLAACASDTGYPSLSPRAIESRPDVADTRPVALADPALDARAAALLADAERAEAAFERAAGTADAAVAAARNATPGDERWIAAQIAVSALEAERGGAVAAVQALDALRFEVAERTRAVDTSRLDAAFARASTVADAQATRFAALSSAVAPR